MLSKILSLLISVLFLTACSLYSSEGRKNFEKADLSSSNLTLYHCQLIHDPELQTLLEKSEEIIWGEGSFENDSITSYALVDGFVQECFYKQTPNLEDAHD